MKKDKHRIINQQAAKLAKMKKAGLQKATTAATATAKKTKPVKNKLQATDLTNAEIPVAIEGAEIAGQTANLQVEFHNTDTGLSDFTATHNGAGQTIHESGTISFSNVKTSDTILISGDSAGSTVVKISGVQAVPMEMNFDAGQHIGGLFLIVS